MYTPPWLWLYLCLIFRLFFKVAQCCIELTINSLNQIKSNIVQHYSREGKYRGFKVCQVDNSCKLKLFKIWLKLFQYSADCLPHCGNILSDKFNPAFHLNVNLSVVASSMVESLLCNNLPGLTPIQILENLLKIQLLLSNSS